jgi:murein DD-endopeptidase MepM/ murein hydrolase activator NlpD
MGRLFGRQLAAALCLLVGACATTAPQGYESPVSGVLTSHYGARTKGFHHGVDIAAPKGTKVKAARGGTVVFRGRKRGFGKLIIVDHGGGVESYYAHLSGFSARKGEKVKRGEVIGKVGRSGKASGHHLHFELRQHGRSIDPRAYVPL